MRTYTYHTDYNFEGKQPLVFIDKVIQYAGIDYITETKNMYEGTDLILKSPLKDGDVVVIHYSSEVLYFRVKKAGRKVVLVDEVNDFTRYERWVDGLV